MVPFSSWLTDAMTLSWVSTNANVCFAPRHIDVSTAKLVFLSIERFNVYAIEGYMHVDVSHKRRNVAFSFLFLDVVVIVLSGIPTLLQWYGSLAPASSFQPATLFSR